MLSGTMWPHSSYSSTGVFIRLLFDEIFCKESQLLHIRYGKCRKYPKFQINKEIRLQISFSSTKICTYVDASIITKCHVVKLSGCHHSQSVVSEVRPGKLSWRSFCSNLTSILCMMRRLFPRLFFCLFDAFVPKRKKKISFFPPRLPEVFFSWNVTVFLVAFFTIRSINFAFCSLQS